jgi:hypothetical protein
MALNNNNKTIIEERKALVASLRLKGLSQREIVSNLTIQKKLNPKTGNPWSLGIINKDIADIEARWRESCSKDIGEHKARQLAEINEVKKHAWKATEFAVVLKAIDQESHLLGTRAAIKQELTGKDGKAIEVSASVQVYIPDNGRNDRD